MSINNGAICCLGVLSLVPGMRKRLVNNLAFAAPETPGYLIDREDGACYVWDSAYMRLPNKIVCDDGIIHVEFIRKITKQWDVVAFYFSFDTNERKPTKTVIFSHGNATDIGFMYSQCLDLVKSLRINLLSYEYTGYGARPGYTSARAIYNDIESAYAYLVFEKSVHPSDIVLYGQSIGSAPSIHLASTHSVGGLIIHSGIISGLSVIRKTALAGTFFDVFKNGKKIKKTNCPAFIIHGTDDSDISIRHGKVLYKAAPCAYQPWWVEGAGHGDIEKDWRFEYLNRLKDFLASLDNCSALKKVEEKAQLGCVPVVGDKGLLQRRFQSKKFNSFKPYVELVEY